METLLDPTRLNSAISQTEQERIRREKSLSQPPIFMDTKRFQFYSRYAENLSATGTLLRAIKDPASCATDQLIEIMIG